MAEQQQSPGKVFAAIENVMADIAKEGVGKNAANTQQNFMYQAADDVMNALAPILSRHHLIILPSVEQHTLTERITSNQKTVMHALLKLNYTFLCPTDGSSTHVGPIYGEAMDYGDKATNKAMTAAYKYLCKYSFCIPITGDDPDANSHEIAGTGARSDPPSGKHGSVPTPAGVNPSPGTAHAASSAAPSAPVSGNHPDVPRPGGMFGFGKKYRETPWNVMRERDLDFFLNEATGVPQEVRHKIVAELQWRDYELQQMARVDQQTQAEREKPLNDEIPWT